MRYIRFLKTPRIVLDKTSPQKSHIHTLITITSDLGDSFLPYDVLLSVELHSGNSKPPKSPIILWKTLQWTAGMRTLAITLPLPSNQRKADIWPVRVRIGVHEKSSEDVFEALYEPDVRGVVSAWSAPLDPSRGIKEAEKFVGRSLCGPEGQGGEVLQVWEETGESIARHLWDAGITMACHIRELIEKADLKLLRQEKLGVLELGTGCGIVGISIAQSISNAQVYLTDLPEAQEIVERNIANASTQPNSTLAFRELDWDHELPKDLFPDPSSSDKSSPFDLFIAADCTYNSDSSPALVNTLRRLVNISPQAAVLIAMKKRHSSEEIFFDLMAEAHFKTEGVTEYPLPGDEESGEEIVYVYQFAASR